MRAMVRSTIFTAPSSPLGPRVPTYPPTLPGMSAAGWRRRTALRHDDERDLPGLDHPQALASETLEVRGIAKHPDLRFELRVLLLEELDLMAHAIEPRTLHQVRLERDQEVEEQPDHDHGQDRGPGGEPDARPRHRAGPSRVGGGARGHSSSSSWSAPAEGEAEANRAK